MSEVLSPDLADERVERPGKSSAAFRTISEVADDLDVAQHVLRFWESKFAQVRPLKRGGGRRYYRPEDVHLLRQIRSLLYDEGYTIKGVQRLLRDGTDEGPQGTTGELPLGDPPPPLAAEEQETAALRAALAELEAIASDLRALAG